MDIKQAGQTIASNLRAEIARQKRRKGDLAPVLNLSPAAVTRRLSGETPLDVNELCAVAAWLNVPITTLLPEPPEGGTTRQKFADSPALAVAA